MFNGVPLTHYIDKFQAFNSDPFATDVLVYGIVCRYYWCGFQEEMDSVARTAAAPFRLCFLRKKASALQDTHFSICYILSAFYVMPKMVFFFFFW